MPDVFGVAIVTYNTKDVIIDCLESLVSAANADGVTLDIAVVDNASQDGSAQFVRDWAAGRGTHPVSGDLPFDFVPVPKPLSGHRLTVLESAFNTGFAGGVNQGVAYLMQTPGINRVWILNPDGIVPPGTPAALTAQPDGFGLMGGRVLYQHAPDIVQTDGGRLNRWSGATSGVNLSAKVQETVFPQAATLDFISGAHMVVSRLMWDFAGPMRENYFLYYEEADWSLRRGNLPLVALEQAVIYHRGGSSIGSGTVDRKAAPMSLYFLHRARHRFMQRMYPRRMPAVWAYTLAKTARVAMSGDILGARTLLCGALDAAPPAGTLSRLSPEALTVALPPQTHKSYIAASK